MEALNGEVPIQRGSGGQGSYIVKWARSTPNVRHRKTFAHFKYYLLSTDPM